MIFLIIVGVSIIVAESILTLCKTPDSHHNFCSQTTIHLFVVGGESGQQWWWWLWSAFARNRHLLQLWHLPHPLNIHFHLDDWCLLLWGHVVVLAHQNFMVSSFWSLLASPTSWHALSWECWPVSCHWCAPCTQWSVQWWWPQVAGVCLWSSFSLQLLFRKGHCHCQ